MPAPSLGLVLVASSNRRRHTRTRVRNHKAQQSLVTSSPHELGLALPELTRGGRGAFQFGHGGKLASKPRQAVHLCIDLRQMTLDEKLRVPTGTCPSILDLQKLADFDQFETHLLGPLYEADPVRCR